MKHDRSVCELIITPLLPLKIFRDTYVVNSRIKEGIILVGPGYLSTSIFFISKPLEKMIERFIDIQYLQLRDHLEGRTTALIFDKVRFSPLLTTSSSNRLGDGHAVVEIQEDSSVTHISSPLIGLLLNNQIDTRGIGAPKMWVKPSMIKAYLPACYSLMSGDCLTDTVILGAASALDSCRLFDSLFKLGEKYLSISELNTIEGQVYLLSPERDSLQQAVQYVEMCTRIALRHQCQVAIWGFSRLQLDNGQFVLIFDSFSNLQATLFFHLSNNFEPQKVDLRAERVKMQIEGRLCHTLNPEGHPESKNAEHKDQFSSKKTNDLLNRRNEGNQGEFLGHIVHTHIIKYEVHGLPFPGISQIHTALGEMTLNCISSQIHQSIASTETPQMKAADNQLRCEGSKSNIYHQVGKENISEKSTTETERLKSHKCAVVQGQIQGRKCPSNDQRLEISVLAQEQKGQSCQDLCPQSMNSIKMEHRTPISSSKKPRLPKIEFKEDQFLNEQSTLTKTTSIAKIHEFSGHLPESKHSYQETLKESKRSKLRPSATKFYIPNTDSRQNGYQNHKIQAAIDYFEGF